MRQVSELENRVERPFNSAQWCLIANSLKINPTKTDIVLIKSRRGVNHPFALKIGKVRLEPSLSTKVLGMVVDSNLIFEPQVSTVIKRCYATISGLAKLSRSLPESIKKMLVEPLVFSHLTSCMTVWAGSEKGKKNGVCKKY